jgi:hypothetical protein
VFNRCESNGLEIKQNSSANPIYIQGCEFTANFMNGLSIQKESLALCIHNSIFKENKGSGLQLPLNSESLNKVLYKLQSQGNIFTQNQNENIESTGSQVISLYELEGLHVISNNDAFKSIIPFTQLLTKADTALNLP